VDNGLIGEGRELKSGS